MFATGIAGLRHQNRPYIKTSLLACWKRAQRSVCTEILPSYHIWLSHSAAGCHHNQMQHTRIMVLAFHPIHQSNQAPPYTTPRTVCVRARCRFYCLFAHTLLRTRSQIGTHIPGGFVCAGVLGLCVFRNDLCACVHREAKKSQNRNILSIIFRSFWGIGFFFCKTQTRTEKPSRKSLNVEPQHPGRGSHADQYREAKVYDVPCPTYTVLLFLGPRYSSRLQLR